MLVLLSCCEGIDYKNYTLNVTLRIDWSAGGDFSGKSVMAETTGSGHTRETRPPERKSIQIIIKRH